MTPGRQPCLSAPDPHDRAIRPTGSIPARARPAPASPRGRLSRPAQCGAHGDPSPSWACLSGRAAALGGSSVDRTRAVAPLCPMGRSPGRRRLGACRRIGLASGTHRSPFLLVGRHQPARRAVAPATRRRRGARATASRDRDWRAPSPQRSPRNARDRSDRPPGSIKARPAASQSKPALLRVAYGLAVALAADASPRRKCEPMVAIYPRGAREPPEYAWWPVSQRRLPLGKEKAKGGWTGSRPLAPAIVQSVWQRADSCPGLAHPGRFRKRGAPASGSTPVQGYHCMAPEPKRALAVRAPHAAQSEARAASPCASSSYLSPQPSEIGRQRTSGIKQMHAHGLFPQLRPPRRAIELS